jgi:hypothetical protein
LSAIFAEQTLELFHNPTSGRFLAIKNTGDRCYDHEERGK